jgi:hypothetical protein
MRLVRWLRSIRFQGGVWDDYQQFGASYHESKGVGVGIRVWRKR